MGWRSLIISQPARLRREHYSLAIEQAETACVPFEDIAVIVLNHRQITLTHAVLSTCADYGIALHSLGSNHQPNGVFLPFLRHTRTTRLLRKQLQVGKPLIKQAWSSIVQRKIENQGTCLQLTARKGTTHMASLARRVRSGDSDNIEAQAASFYFMQLFGQDFSRAQSRWINAALNYGYTILRSTITRGLVVHGLHPSIGLFHASEQNAFNLADDLIEPFRPLVDLHVVFHLANTDDELSTSDKAALVGLLNTDVDMPQGRMSTLSAIEYTVESLARMFETEQNCLELPRLSGLQQHYVET